ncbi:MAG: OmpA family protein [Candidatus Hydrogenedentes bacterium]|nr:OmpA family protein [Candidatus Hydrogenedentota bacterium]
METYKLNHMICVAATLSATVLASVTSALAVDGQPEGWGNATGARSPQPDSKGRAGHWWWPEKSDGGGNKGKIYSRQAPAPAPTAAETPVPPPAVEPQPPIVCGHVILNNLLFHPDSVELRPEGIAETQKVIAEMHKFPGDTVTCVGHTDDTGSEAYNLQLGLRRAQAVVDYMKASGIAPERVKAESKGETEPAVPNNTPANRALNRRVAFQYKMGN